MFMKPYISLYQRKIAPLPESGSAEDRAILNICQKSETIVFPEYFSMHKGLGNLTEMVEYSVATYEWLINLSQQPEAKDTLIAGGTILQRVGENFFNTLPVFFNGTLLNTYRKRELFENEKLTLTAGTKSVTILHPVSHKSYGLLICADVRKPEIFNDYKNNDYILIPTASPFIADDNPLKQSVRDQTIYVAGARSSGATIIKCCGTGCVTAGSLSNKAHAIQGRSLVATGESLPAVAPGIEWNGFIMIDKINQQIEIFPLAESSL